MSSPASPAPRTLSVVVADEHPANVGIASELRRRGYAVTLEPDRSAVPRILAERPAVAAIMSGSGDVRSDVTFLLRILEADPRVSVLVLGEKLDASAVSQLAQSGAANCVTEKVRPPLVADAIERAVLLREAELADGRKIGHLKATLQEVTRQLDREGLAMRQRWVGSLAALVRLAEASHPHMAGHSLRVADLAGAIAVAMGHTDSEVETIRLAGRLHDLGMVSVPARIIDKAGTLTEEEFALVRQHPVVASEILGSFPNFGEITRGIRGHHEHWDGSGYPDGLVGDQIPRISLILAAAEVFDALVSPRPYKRAEDTEAALARIRSISGRILDPAVCEALITVISSRQTLPFLAEAQARVREVPAMKFPEREPVQV